MIGPAVSSTHGSGTVRVPFIPTPRYDEVDHMPVSGMRMHRSGLVFIFHLEHGAPHYQEQRDIKKHTEYLNDSIKTYKIRVMSTNKIHACIQ